MADYKKIRGGADVVGGDSIQKFSAMSADDPDVVALWNFDEASGNLVDVVNGLVLAPNIADPAIIYQTEIDEVTNGGRLSEIAPSVCQIGNTRYFSGTGLGSTLNPSGDFTLEWYFRAPYGGTVCYLSSGDAGATPADCFYLYITRVGSTGDGVVRFQLYATDGSTIQVQTPTITDISLRDGDVHHLRVNYTTNGVDTATAKIFIDGVEAHSQNVDALAAKSMVLNNLAVFGYYGSGSGFLTNYIYQFRISHNATNNGYGYA